MTGATRAPAFRLRPLTALASPAAAIRQFTPNWFAATMGTGILSITLAQVPGAPAWAHPAAEALWRLNIGLFVVFSALYLTRWVIYPSEARRIFDHSLMSMYLGCIPMGLATIVNGLLLFGAPRWGQGAVDAAELLWRIDAGLAVACGLAVPFMMFTRQSHSLERMTAVWLLPVVACEVAAVTAGMLAPRLIDPADQLQTVVAGYALWALSVPLALGVIAILFLRMVAHSLPPAEMAASNWLALGPIATGALGLMALGAASPAVFGAARLTELGVAAKGLGLLGGLLLWAYGLWWAAMGVMTTVRYLRDGLPFNLGWWGYTFPLGVFAAATIRLAGVLPIPALVDFAQGLVATLAVVWLVVAGRTLAGAWRGELFSAPCLAAHPAP